MFTRKQIDFMKDRVGLKLNYDNLSDDDYMKIETEVGFFCSAEVMEYESGNRTQKRAQKISMCDDILAHIDDDLEE